jgi:hypothetical protein
MTPKGTRLSESDTQRLHKVASKVYEKRKLVAQLEGQLAQAAQELNGLEFQQLPDLMHELGVDSMTFQNGLTVKLSMFYKATLPQSKSLRERGLAWLRANGFGGIIKHEITATLPVGQSKYANALTKFLDKIGQPYTDKENVHHATLTAFIKEQFEQGNGKLPLDALGAFIGERGQVKW